MKEKIERSMKIKAWTLRFLNELKPEFEKSYPDKYISNDFVVGALIHEHNELNDPDLIREKEKKLHDEYVETSEYHRLYNENIGDKKKVKELEDKLENQLKETHEKENQLNCKLEEQQDLYNNTQEKLIKREKENKELNQRIEKLNQNNLEKEQKLKQKASSLSEKYKDLDIEHNKLTSFVNNECITKEMLKHLYYMIWFLSKHKRKMFTLDQIDNKLFQYHVGCPIGKLEEAIVLSNYKIFPIKKYLIDDKEYFQFNREYMK